jgi:hypothetical protein
MRTSAPVICAVATVRNEYPLQRRSDFAWGATADDDETNSAIALRNVRCQAGHRRAYGFEGIAPQRPRHFVHDTP